MEYHMENIKFENSIVEYIANPNGVELLSEIGEHILDSTLTDDSLKDIPIVGWISKYLSIHKSFSDKLFLKKLLSFMQNLQSITKPEIQSFQYKINNDEEFKSTDTNIG